MAAAELNHRAERSIQPQPSGIWAILTLRGLFAGHLGWMSRDSMSADMVSASPVPSSVTFPPVLARAGLGSGHLDGLPIASGNGGCFEGSPQMDFRVRVHSPPACLLHAQARERHALDSLLLAGTSACRDTRLASTGGRRLPTCSWSGN